MVAVSRAQRYRCVRHDRLAGHVWTSEERALENSASGWSLVAGADARSNLRNRTRQHEVVCDLSRSCDGKNSVAERSTALAFGPFTEAQWCSVADLSNLRNRTRQHEVVCDLSRSCDGKNSVAERSTALAFGPFTEAQWCSVAESGD